MRTLLSILGSVYRTVAWALVVVVLFVMSLTLFDDPVSQQVRTYTEAVLNTYVADLAERADADQLSEFDHLVMRSSVSWGLSLGSFAHPEAADSLYHYLYGDGSRLQLPAKAFETSEYLQSMIEEYGEGEHGPLVLTQAEDPRLFWMINPYYLSVTADTVRIYHPWRAFEPSVQAGSTEVIVPVGKMQLKVRERLLTSFEPKPFYVYAEWER